MLYAIVTSDIDKSLEKRLEKRQEHRQRIVQLQEDGKLILAGPCPNVDSTEPGEAGFSGSLIVAEFPSLDSAKEWANNDPYVLNGTYESVTVKPFIKVFS